MTRQRPAQAFRGTRCALRPSGPIERTQGPSTIRGVAARGAARLVLLGIIVFVGLGLRGAYLAELVHKPDYDAPLPMPIQRLLPARSSAGTGRRPRGAGSQIATTPYFARRLYVFPGRLYRFFGRGISSAARANGAGLVNIVLSFLIGRAVFGRVRADWSGARCIVLGVHLFRR